MANELKIQLTVDDKGSVKIKKFGKNVKDAAGSGKGFGSSMQTAATGAAKLATGAISAAAKVTALGASMAAAGAGFAITESLKQFSAFESALIDMGKVTDESFGKIQTTIMELDPALGSATEMVRGYYQVISAGVTEPTAALETLIGSAKLAKTAHMEQAEAVKGLTSVMDSFKVEVNEAADAMQTIEKTGKTSVGELIPIIGEVSGMAQSAGLSLNEMSSAFAAITLQSGGTEKAATQFKAVITSLISPTKEMAALLGEYGGAQEAIKKLGFDGVMRLIAEATGGNAEATKKLMGSVEGYLGYLGIASNEMKTYNANMEEQKNKTGALAAAWEEYKGTLTALWETFKNTIATQAVLIGEQLAPAVKDILEKTNQWLTANRDLIACKLKEYIEALTGAVKESGISFQTMLESLEAVVKIVKSVAEGILYLGKVIGETAAKLYGFYEKIGDLGKSVGNFLGDLIGPAKEAEAAIINVGDTAEQTASKIESLGPEFKIKPIALDSLKLAEDTARKTSNNIESLDTEFKIKSTATEQLKKVEGEAELTASSIQSLNPTFSINTTPAMQGLGDLAAMAQKLAVSLANAMVWGNPQQVASLQWEISHMLAEQKEIERLTQSNLAMFSNWGYNTPTPSGSSDLSGVAPLSTQSSYSSPYSYGYAMGFQSGTGPGGLPYTGWFYGHQGEIVKNPAESDKERRGRSGDINITIAPTFFTGDRTGAKEAARAIYAELKELGHRGALN